MAVHSIYMLIDPDWLSSVKLSHVWKTSIQKSVTGVEKRSALYTWARKKINVMLVTYGSEESNWLLRKLWKYTHYVWGVPLWQDVAIVDQQALAGQKNIGVSSTEYKHFEVGNEVLIQDQDDYSSYEIGEIASLLTTQITLVDNLVSTWEVGTVVYPIISARLENTGAIRNYTDITRSINIDFEETYE